MESLEVQSYAEILPNADSSLAYNYITSVQHPRRSQQLVLWSSTYHEVGRR